MVSVSILCELEGNGGDGSGCGLAKTVFFKEYGEMQDAGKLAARKRKARNIRVSEEESKEKKELMKAENLRSNELDQAQV